MHKLMRFISGSMLGGALLMAGIALTPTPSAAQRELILACTENVCCTVDAQTGELVSCKRIG